MNKNYTFTLIFILLLSLACGNADQTSTDMVILTRLPTLTPTLLPGQAAPIEPEPTSVLVVPAPEGNTDQPPVTGTDGGETAGADTTPLLAEVTPQPEEAEIPAPVESNSPVVISTVDRVQEMVELENVSDEPQDLIGWSLVSELDGQKCNLAGVLPVGGKLRVWALAQNAASGGYNCGFSNPIWDDAAPDAAVLYNPDGTEMMRVE